MKFNKKAFTLTELLIALGVIGILAAILMPVITNMLPDQNAIMAKRAYYTVQNVVSDMINDADCYPDTSKAARGALVRLGFDDGNYYPNCKKWKDAVDFYESDVCDKDEEGNCKKDADDKDIILHYAEEPIEGDADLKFARIFTDIVDLQGDPESDDSIKTAPFKTKDGIEWQFSNLDYFADKDNKNNPDICATIYIDVNGEKGPNRRDSENLNEIFGRYVEKTVYNSEHPATYDVFSVNVCQNGKIKINDTWAKNVVDIDYNLYEY